MVPRVYIHEITQSSCGFLSMRFHQPQLLRVMYRDHSARYSNLYILPHTYSDAVVRIAIVMFCYIYNHLVLLAGVCSRGGEREGTGRCRAEETGQEDQEG